jgi:hypothetical protein
MGIRKLDIGEFAAEAADVAVWVGQALHAENIVVHLCDGDKSVDISVEGCIHPEFEDDIADELAEELIESANISIPIKTGV